MSVSPSILVTRRALERELDTPRLLARPARVLGVAGLIGAAALAFAPWVQNASGTGDVTAFSPVDREQTIGAPVKGRIVKWHVLEGAHVEAGAPLVDLEDIDPSYTSRLETTRDAVLDRIAAAEAQMEAYATQAEAYEEAGRLKFESAGLEVGMARQKVLAAEQKLTAAEAATATARLQIKRTRKLFEDGLSSRRDLELTELSIAKAETEENQARAALLEAKALESAKKASHVRARAEAAAKVASSSAARRKASAEVAYARAELAKIETSLSRQRAQRVTAPAAGTVVRMLGNQGGAIVSVGETLAVIVPDAGRRAVQVWVDGNDAPLITPGRKVRLQFEGWPAVQFAGWPSVAVGTFGGEVAFVDAASRREGAYRVLVVPDDDEPEWPDTRWLRLGARAKAWVLLDEVRLGYELWRRFNGFPLQAAPPEEGALAAPAGEGSKGGKKKKGGGK
jgi:adhesin transport system membrane fusion protein